MGQRLGEFRYSKQTFARSLIDKKLIGKSFHRLCQIIQIDWFA